MQFTNLSFFAFFAIFFVFYIVFSRRLWMQNLWLLLAGYVFYSLFGLRILLVLVLITVSDFSLALLMERFTGSNRASIRSILVGMSLLIDLGLLVFFKYYGFFEPGFVRILHLAGISADPTTLDLLLPVGISFYALKSISYTLDVYHGRQVPVRNLLDYAIFVSFFPALLAGPIDRAKNLLPQIQHARQITSSKVTKGLSLILWGMFKKLAVADNLALITDQVFKNGGNAYGLDIIIGILAFSIQIYADFSGYSDIARGLASLLGFDLMINFKLPYFALNPADFWQRWHISLSEWLRDYIFYPIRRWVLLRQAREMRLLALLFPPIITMLASGLWHGTGWNFIVWGLYHAGLLIIYRLLADMHLSPGLKRILNSFPGVALRVVVMFILVSFGWLFFRADSLAHAFQLIGMLSLKTSPQSTAYINDLLFFSLPLGLAHLWQAYKENLLVLSRQRVPIQVLVNSIILVWIIIFGARQVTEFIYSQF